MRLFRYRYRTLIATELYFYLCYRMLQNGAATERIRCLVSQLVLLDIVNIRLAITLDNYQVKGNVPHDC